MALFPWRLRLQQGDGKSKGKGKGCKDGMCKGKSKDDKSKDKGKGKPSGGKPDGEGKSNKDQKGKGKGDCDTCWTCGRPEGRVQGLRASSPNRSIANSITSVFEPGHNHSFHYVERCKWRRQQCDQGHPSCFTTCKLWRQTQFEFEDMC